MSQSHVRDSSDTDRWVGPHHAGGGSVSSGTDHDIRDVAAPGFLALLVGQQGQGSLLQLVGSTGSCGRHRTHRLTSCCPFTIKVLCPITITIP